MTRASHDVADRWLERFWTAFHARRPVDATFIGRHEHDHRLPDLGEAALGDHLAEMRGLLGDLPAGPADGDSPRAIDLRLAEGFLTIQIEELEAGRMVDNPSFLVGEAVFGMMALLLSDFAPERERLEALEARMAAVPAYLADARVRVARDTPGSWIRRAQRECRGALAFLCDGVEGLDRDFGRTRERAIEAFEDFAEHLVDVGADGAAVRPVACGPEAFDRYLRGGHALDRSADDVLAYAREELALARDRLRRAAEDLGADDPGAALTRLNDAHPNAEGYYAAYGECWTEMRQVAEASDLVTWPEHPIRYAPRPEWSRAAAPDLYFLFYRSPAAYGAPAVHEYRVAPLDASAPPAEVQAFLRANNHAVIKLNHVVHHGGLGHHVQNWHARRAPTEVGRVAAVDGASRIAMFCGGTMAEGWACYATDLMAEVGALTPLEELAERHGRVRMCARAVVDVELHHGRMSLDEAAAFYEEVALMSPAAAGAEAVKNSMYPAAALIYLVGTDAIHDLRADVVRDAGVTLCDFHDAFLSYGSIPVAIAGAAMRRRARLGLPLGAHDEVATSNPEP